MKAAVFRTAAGGFQLEDLAEPAPGPGDVIIRVDRCGICGSDLHMAEPGEWQFRDGTVPGHEYAGEVVALGKAVSGLNVGDRITALPATGCGHCPACERGNLILCPGAQSVMGGYGQYMAVASSSALRLPQTLSAADGALVEPMAVGLYAIRQAAIKADDRVLVLGAGSIAMAAIYWARQRGCGRIVAMSRSASRAAAVTAVGADGYLCYGGDEQAEIVEALGGPPDVVLECVGVPGFLMKAVQLSQTYGKVVSLGFCMSADTLVPALAAFKAVTLLFPLGYSLDDFQMVADSMDAGRVDPQQMLTSVVSLAELPRAFDRLRAPGHGEIKVQVAPHRD